MPELHVYCPQPSDLESVIRIHGDPRTNQFKAAVETSQPGEVIGFCGVMCKNMAHLQGLNLYFRFASQAWGKGYATRLACAELDLAFNTLGASKVLALVRPANMPSRRTLERVGFIQLATASDVAGEDAASSIGLAGCCITDHSKEPAAAWRRGWRKAAHPHA